MSNAKKFEELLRSDEALQEKMVALASARFSPVRHTSAGVDERPCHATTWA